MGDEEELDPSTEDNSNFNEGGHDIAFMTCTIQALCAFAKLCCQLNQFDMAWAYLIKAKTYSHRCPLSHLSASVAFHIGLYHEMKNNLDLAESQYLIALAIHDNHVRSMVHLGSLFHRQAAKTEDKLAKTQYLDKAYGYLLNAIRLDSTSHQAWYHYGVTLEGLGQTEKAATAFLTSLEWESTAPLRRYEDIAIEL
jgi:tetratricopeptide (TPR) repeat protein